MFGFSKIKLIGYGLALLAVLGVVWQVNHWRVQAGQKKAAVAALAIEVKAHKDDLAAAKTELAVSEKARVKLLNDNAAIGEVFAAQLASIEPKTLIVTKVVPGETCPRSTLSPDFFLRFNAAGQVPAPLQ
jgi:hypothetical protein